MMLVDILRHGQPEGGDVLRGRVDHPLSPLGWQQMYESVGLPPDGSKAGRPPWTRVISSPLQRCREFAERLSRDCAIPLTVAPAWQEIDYGSWDGMPVSRWRQLAAPQFEAFRQDMTALTPPEGEAFTDFRDRVLGAWQQLTDSSTEQHVLLITHGGVMRVILPTVLGIPLNRSGVLQIPFACLSRVELAATTRPAAALVFHNGRI